MKVAIYVRVSLDRQAEKELSISAQIKATQQQVVGLTKACTGRRRLVKAK